MHSRSTPDQVKERLRQPAGDARPPDRPRQGTGGLRAIAGRMPAFLRLSKKTAIIAVTVLATFFLA